MLIKLVLGEETINIIVHASQIGLEEYVKENLWEDMDELIHGLPKDFHWRRLERSCWKR